MTLTDELSQRLRSRTVGLDEFRRNLREALNKSVLDHPGDGWLRWPQAMPRKRI
jgi:hypothetical protein